MYKLSTSSIVLNEGVPGGAVYFGGSNNYLMQDMGTSNLHLKSTNGKFIEESTSFSFSNSSTLLGTFRSSSSSTDGYIDIGSTTNGDTSNIYIGLEGGQRVIGHRGSAGTIKLTGNSISVGAATPNSSYSINTGGDINIPSGCNYRRNGGIVMMLTEEEYSDFQKIRSYMKLNNMI